MTNSQNNIIRIHRTSEMAKLASEYSPLKKKYSVFISNSEIPGVWLLGIILRIFYVQALLTVGLLLLIYSRVFPIYETTSVKRNENTNNYKLRQRLA